MKLKAFKDKISKGLGSPILFLKNNPEQAYKYSKVILWACCHDTRYDSQCESGRSAYLYAAICLSNRKSQLENDVLDRLLRTKGYRDVEQLFNIAQVMYDNGNNNAKEVMYDRFKDYLNRVQKIKVVNFNNSRHILECATAGAINIVAVDKFNGLEFILDIMGKIMISKKIKDLFDIDWVLSYAKNEFGEENLKSFLQDKSQANPNIKAVVEMYHSNEQERHEYQQNKKTVVPDFETIFAIVEKYCEEEKLRWGRRNILRRIGKKAGKNELIKVAEVLETTTDETKQIALLHVFNEVEYPLSIDFLLRLAYDSCNKLLVTAAADVLKNTKDVRIHDLAIHLIKDREFSICALGLLVKNFQHDYELILDLLKIENERLKTEKSEFDFHGLTMGVRRIFEHNKSSESLDILYFLYQNTTCSSCRMKIVQIMCDNNILPHTIAEECLYDCDEATRDMALKYLAGKAVCEEQ